MATMLTNLVLSPENLNSIRDAVQQKFYEVEDFERFVRVMRVKDTTPIALIGELEDVGLDGAGCDPEYSDADIANSQKRWEFGDWSIALKICYEALEGTIAEYSFKTGTAKGDLTDTDFMAIYTLALERAMKRMIWRFGWFGDKAADTVANGGVLKNGTDTKLFSVCDGLFKRIFTQVTANSAQYTAIAANSQASYAAQKSAILASGVATSLFDTILMDADSRLFADGGSVLMMTKGLADALAHDIRVTYKDNLPFERIFDGFEVAEYAGVRVARVSIWDNIIKTYENDGTKYNKPYRAVFANPENLLVGTNAESLISDLDIWFDKKERRNYIYATGKIDANLLDEALFHAAY